MARADRDVIRRALESFHHCDWTNASKIVPQILPRLSGVGKSKTAR